jgi:hypothetical protein
MILKIFSPNILAKKLAYVTLNYVKSIKKNISFREKAIFFARKIGGNRRK